MTYPYIPPKPPLAESSDQLRARIPGWGADLNPQDRPSVPKLQFDESVRDAKLPERQPEKWPRERSVEHAFLTPVFGTSCPPKGLSGAIRKLSYARYSEGRAAHWLLLMLADRVDTFESTLGSFLSLHPDNLVTETGVLSEFRVNGVRSRLASKRVDKRHQLLDPVIVAGPWLLAGWGTYKVGKRVVQRFQGSW
jgi:hypothetical protein